MAKVWALRIKRISRFHSMVFLVVAAIVFGFLGLEFSDELELVKAPEQPVSPPPGQVSLVIKVPERILEVYNDGTLWKTYRIAVGTSSTPTPIGEWNIVWKDYNWGTGFGTRWMGLNVPWGIYGIHGTNKPWSIGKFASHGCIRMRNRDIEELFEWVAIGTHVRIEGRPAKVQRVLRYQMTGPDVVVLQIKLKELGYLDGRADGIFGKKTEQALVEYQKANGLEPTGKLDRQTLQRLGI